MPQPPPTRSLEPVPGCLACGSPARRPALVTRAMMHPERERFAFSRCDACGLVYLDPRVPAAELGRYYTAHYLPYRGPGAWGRWSALVARGLRATDRRRVARVRRAVPELGPASRVLDVGCGRPTFLEALVQAADCRCVGTDFSDEGWRDEPRRWAGMELRRGELAELELEGPFDVVTLWHYLEHDYDPGATLARLRRWAHPGTRLLLEVPDHDSWSRRRYGAHWAGYHTPRHTALWEASTLRLLLERSGWRVEGAERRGTLDPWALVWMSRQERRGIDWSASLEGRFAGYLAGRVVVWPLLSAWERLRGRGGDGLITVEARPA